MERHCTYCSNILKALKQPPSKPWDDILHESHSFVVTPTVGAMVEGWILIISKRHVPAMGALQEEELDELFELALIMRKLMQPIYGPIAIFEHGPACEGTSFGCGVDHAHFHLVPLQIPLSTLVKDELRTSAVWEEIHDIRHLSRIHLSNLSYLYILENDKENGSVACLKELPSQFTRRIIANYLGIPHLYDYRKHEFIHNVSKTVHRLEAASIGDKHCLIEAI